MLTNDCGQSCAHFILRLYRINLSIYSVKDQLPLTKEGVSFNELQHFFEKFNLSASGYYFENLSFKKVSFPAIAQVKLYDSYHFIIILSKNKFTYTIYDPNYGIKKISTINFKKISTGYFLILEKPNPNLKLELTIPKVSIPKALIGLIIFTTIISFSDTLYFKYLLEDYQTKQIYLYTIIYIMVNIFKYLLIGVVNYSITKLTKAYSLKIHQILIKRINNILPIKNTYLSDFQNRIQGINHYQYYLFNILNYWFSNSMIIILGVIIAFSINKYLSLLMLLLIIIILTIIKAFSYTLKASNYRLNQAWIEYNEQLLKFEYLSVGNAYNSYLSALTKYTHLINIENLVRMVTFIIGYGGIIVLNIYLINLNTLSIATFIQFNTIVINVIGPIHQLINNLDVVRDYKLAQGRINQLL